MQDGWFFQYDYYLKSSQLNQLRKHITFKYTTSKSGNGFFGVDATINRKNTQELKDEWLFQCNYYQKSSKLNQLRKHITFKLRPTRVELGFLFVGATTNKKVKYE